MKELATALKGVGGEVQNKIFKNMSERAVGMLKEDMEFMGPVRLRVVEESQQKIVSVIRRLEEAGEIVVGRSGEEEILV
jgi:flagellar motor switch protein FliG